MSLPDAFYLGQGDNPPAILSIEPDTLSQGDELEIFVTAENIDFTQGTNVLSFTHETYAFAMLAVDSSHSTGMVFDNPFNADHPSGYYDLLIKNTLTDISVEKENAFYVGDDLSLAMLDAISPVSARQDEHITLTIEATNTNFSADGVDNEVYLKGDDATMYPVSVSATGDGTLEATFEFSYSDPVGTYNLHVSNDLDGTMKLSGAFELQAGNTPPAILSVEPDTAFPGQTLDIEVTAEYIDFTQGTNVVSLKQGSHEIYMNSFMALEASRLKANITLAPDDPVGNYDLRIWNTAIDVTLVSNQTIVKENGFYLKSAGIEDAIAENWGQEISFYPNPCDKHVYFKKPCEHVQVIDLNGRVILEASHANHLDVSKIQEGIYFLKIKAPNGTFVDKLLVR
jgi:hypothetical protein